MPMRLFSIKVGDNVISDISHVLLARKATLPQELPVTEILTQLSGYNVSCPGRKSPPTSRSLAPFSRGLRLSFFAPEPHGGNACYAR